jgi:hypothetical protein
VFTVVADPVGAGYVQSLARPGGNATGFTGFEYAFAGKWLELLKEVATIREAGGGPSRIWVSDWTGPVRGNSGQSRQHLAWSYGQSIRAMSTRSRALSRRSRRARMAA